MDARGGTDCSLLGCLRARSVIHWMGGGDEKSYEINHFLREGHSYIYIYNIHRRAFSARRVEVACV